MIEIRHEYEERSVVRNEFSLPSHWEPQTNDIQIYELQENSEDYLSLKTYFMESISNKCRKIISITRIQNQRWYSGYESFKKYLRNDNDERWLFHGCCETATESIMYTSFNRSFAGAHGQ